MDLDASAVSREKKNPLRAAGRQPSVCDLCFGLTSRESWCKLHSTSQDDSKATEADRCAMARRADAQPLAGALALNRLKKLLLWLFAGPHKFQLLMGQRIVNNQAEPGE